MSLRAVRDAVIASLGSDLPGAVFKPRSVPSSAPSRYAVVWVRRASKDRSRFSSGQVRDVFTVTVHSVGSDDDSCLWVQERVDGLTGRALVVPGRVLWPVEFVTGQPSDLDDDGDRPLWWSVSQFDIVSDPA